jgi:hypothetical protein
MIIFLIERTFLKLEGDGMGLLFDVVEQLSGRADQAGRKSVLPIAEFEHINDTERETEGEEIEESYCGIR